MPLYQSGIPQNAKVVRDMRLRTAEDFCEIRDTFFAHQEAFQDAETCFIAHSPQDGGTLTGSREVGDLVAWHQQQLPPGAQLTASPSTRVEFRW